MLFRSFIRDKRHVSLTNYGMLYLEYVDRILNLEKTSIAELNAYETYSNNLKIGATNSIYECHLFDLISKYEQSSPENAINVSIDHSQELIQFLQDGLLDLVFSFLPFQKAGYECEPFHADQLVLTTSYDNTLYRDGIKQSELTNIKYLMCNFALNDVTHNSTISSTYDNASATFTANNSQPFSVKDTNVHIKPDFVNEKVELVKVSKTISSGSMVDDNVSIVSNSSIGSTLITNDASFDDDSSWAGRTSWNTWKTTVVYEFLVTSEGGR